MIYLHLSLLILAGYFVGNISFARIFSKLISKKDITKEGSKNPGTMNMLRTNGFVPAILTLSFDALKTGLPALGLFFLFKHYFPLYDNLAFFLFSFAVIVGHCFPVFYKFKGGKGIASAFGMFLFHPEFWWVSLILFAVGFILFFFIPYAFLLTNGAILFLTIFAICIFAIHRVDFWIAILVVLLLDEILILFLHRRNIARLFAGTENKINFREKVFKHKKNKSSDVEESK